MAGRAVATVVLMLVLAGCLAGRDGTGGEIRPLALDVFETGFVGYEPSIGVDASGRIFVAGASVSTEPLATAAAAIVVRSTDGGNTWQAVDSFPITSDPVLHVDDVTQRVYRAHMFSTTCTNLAWSDDGGSTWLQRPMACGEGRDNDFIKLGSGRPGPQDRTGDGADHILYLCHNRNAPGRLTTVCAVSRDGGVSWPLESVVADRDRDGAGGVTSFPATSASGTVVVPVSGRGGLNFAVSEDSGQTWQVRRLPFTEPDMTVTARMAFDGETAYALWATYGGLWLGKSDDLRKWTRIDVLPPGVGSVTHVGMDVVAPGVVAYAFLGTPETGIPAELPAGTPWRLHAGASSPIGLHMASDDLVHVGSICYGGSDCPRNLGDFFDAAAGPDGDLWYSFVDGCDGCAEAQATGNALKVAVVRVPKD